MFNRVFSLYKALLVLIAVILLNGCVTENKVVKYLNKNPLVAADYCAYKYPTTEKIIQGKEVVKIDTFTNLRVDTVTLTDTINGKTKIIKLACPPCKEKIIYKTINKTDTIIQKGAEFAALQLKNNDLNVNLGISNKNLLEAKKIAKNRLYIIIALIGLIAISAYLNFRFRK